MSQFDGMSNDDILAELRKYSNPAPAPLTPAEVKAKATAEVADRLRADALMKTDRKWSDDDSAFMEKQIREALAQL